MEVIDAKPDVGATAGDGVAVLGGVVMTATRTENSAEVPLTLELAEILIAGLAVGHSGTETKRQGKQQTPMMPSDKAHALLHGIRSSSTGIDSANAARQGLLYPGPHDVESDQPRSTGYECNR